MYFMKFGAKGGQVQLHRTGEEGARGDSRIYQGSGHHDGTSRYSCGQYCVGICPCSTARFCSGKNPHYASHIDEEEKGTCTVSVVLEIYSAMKIITLFLRAQLDMLLRAINEGFY